MYFRDILFIFNKSNKDQHKFINIMNRKLEGQPYICDLKEIISDTYFDDIMNAIDTEDLNKVSQLLSKYLRKKEVVPYFNKITKGLQNLKIDNQLDDEPYMHDLKEILQTAYFKEIKNAIQDRNEDKILELLSKYLRKKEVVPYFNKITKGLQKLTQGQESSWSTLEIASYLKNKLDNVQFQYFKDVIRTRDPDLCRSFLIEYLRYDEGQEIMPHIESLIKNQQVQDFIRNQLPKNKTNPNKDKPLQQTNIEKPPNKPKIQNPQKIVNEKSKEQLQKESLLKKLKQQIDEEEFNQLLKYLEKGRFSKPRVILQQFFGVKKAEKYLTQMRKYYAEQTNDKLSNSKLIKKGEDGIQFYKLNVSPIVQSYLKINQDNVINVLVIGKTGVGKSTYLNAIANYLMDVNMEDNFRYILNDDCLDQNPSGKSMTQDMHIYEIQESSQNKKIRLIDVPGLGDTQGIKKDTQHIELIRKGMKDKISCLHLIIYIFKATQTRLTTEYKYVMGQTMGMFAKNVAPNILFLLTFADNMEPTILPTLKNNFSDIISNIQKHYGKGWFIKINNSALFKKIDGTDPMDLSFYKMGNQCLKKTVERMLMSKKVDTKDTQRVLRNRKQLEQIIAGFHDHIKHNLEKQEDIRKIIRLISIECDELKGSKNYEIQVKEEVITEQKTANNVTSCLNCKFTCHKDCAYSNNQDKINCYKMTDGKCVECPGQCSWKAHINDYIIIKRQHVSKKKTIQELYKRYQVASKDKHKNENLLARLVEQYCIGLIKLEGNFKKLKQLNNDLSQLELLKINHATVAEYIQIMIDSEKNEKKPGYRDRVTEYQILKDHEIRKQKLLKQGQQNSMQSFKEMMQSKIKELIYNEQLVQRVLKIFAEANIKYSKMTGCS